MVHDPPRRGSFCEEQARGDGIRIEPDAEPRRKGGYAWESGSGGGRGCLSVLLERSSPGASSLGLYGCVWTATFRIDLVWVVGDHYGFRRKG